MRELVITIAKVVLVLAKNDLLSWKGAYNYSMKQADVEGQPQYALKHYADTVKTLAPKINEMQDLITELQVRLDDVE